jgi:hypothetical protein
MSGLRRVALINKALWSYGRNIHNREMVINIYTPSTLFNLCLCFTILMGSVKVKVKVQVKAKAKAKARHIVLKSPSFQTRRNPPNHSGTRIEGPTNSKPQSPQGIHSTNPAFVLCCARRSVRSGGANVAAAHDKTPLSRFRDVVCGVGTPRAVG